MKVVQTLPDHVEMHGHYGSRYCSSGTPYSLLLQEWRQNGLEDVLEDHSTHEYSSTNIKGLRITSGIKGIIGPFFGVTLDDISRKFESEHANYRYKYVCIICSSH